MGDDVLLRLFQFMSKCVTLTAKETLALHKSALNCLSNIINNEYVLPKAANDLFPELYRRIKDVLLMLTKRLQQNPKSKKTIIHVTTVVRSFQLVMDKCLAIKKIMISDSEAIILFTALYKFMFLGTNFTQRVLQIQVQPTNLGKINVQEA